MVEIGNKKCIIQNISGFRKEKMIVFDRKKKILEYLNQKHIATIEELQTLTESSASTMRRDLNDLEEEKKLKRVHGGAELLQDLSKELSFIEKSTKNVQEKRQIADRAFSKISDGDTIYLDAGTTTGALIEKLNQSQFRLTIVTNSVTHASKLNGEHLTVYILGGLIKKITDSVVGGNALKQLSNYRFNSSFMGANAFDKEIGAMTPDSEEASVKTSAIHQSEISYLLVDTSKLGETSFVKFANPDEVEVITEEE